MIKAYINMQNKKKEFLACLKKLSRETEKTPIFVHRGPSYADKE